VVPTKIVNIKKGKYNIYLKRNSTPLYNTKIVNNKKVNITLKKHKKLVQKII
jgi:hypothetical protein